MAAGREQHTAALLANGQVLLAGAMRVLLRSVWS